MKDIASFLIDQIALCLREADRHKLPSAAQASVWAAFHRMRERKNISDRWSSFMTNLPSPVEETSLGLQLILDRLLRNTIQNQAAQPGNVSTAAVARPLDKLELNAIRYMAGYIAVKLLKKYRKKAKHPRLQQNRRLFVAVLKHMRADNQPGLTGSTLVDYTEQWSRLVDRGGLYHINDKVFELIESLEKKSPTSHEHFGYKYSLHRRL